MNSRSKKTTQDMIAAMRATNIPPQLIYAYEKTGFLLLEEGYEALSPQERAEYDAAIDEYFATNGKA